MKSNQTHNNFKKRFFSFPEIIPVDEFSFEKLTTSNFTQLYLMFENDDNAFIDYRFKYYDGAKIYAEDREQYAAFSAKHGGQDWFFYWKHSVAGILHLYDLSLETFADNNKRCWIGFATKPELRNKGITKKAAQIFINYIFNKYAFIEYIHAITEKENIASKALLSSLNFKRDFTQHHSGEHHFYMLERSN